MKILQVIPSIAPGFGGPSQAVLGLSAALATLGHEVQLFTTNADLSGYADVPLERPVPQDGFEVYYYPVCFFKKYKFSLRLASALKEKVPYFDVVHIHSLFQFSTLSASSYCRRYHKPYIIRPLGHLDPFALKRHAFLKMVYLNLFERKNLERAAFVHFTAVDEQSLANQTGFSMNGRVEGLGIFTDEFRSLPQMGSFVAGYPQLAGKKIVLFLGRINFKKGVDILIRAFAKLSQDIPDASLVIAGPEDKDYGLKIRGVIRECGVTERVVFAGMLEGVNKLAAMRDASMFVLPSFSENFGLAVVEAMASGLPVVISERVALYREVRDAQAGLVTSNDLSQVYQAMKYLFEHPHEARLMGNRARDLVFERYDWSQVACRMIRLYEEAMQ